MDQGNEAYQFLFQFINGFDYGFRGFPKDYRACRLNWAVLINGTMVFEIKIESLDFVISIEAISSTTILELVTPKECVRGLGIRVAT